MVAHLYRHTGIVGETTELPGADGGTTSVLVGQEGGCEGVPGRLQLDADNTLRENTGRWTVRMSGVLSPAPGHHC